MKKKIITNTVLSFLVWGLCLTAVNAATMTKNGMTVTFDSSNGIQINVDKCLFSRHSEFYITPNWSTFYYGYNQIATTSVSGGTMTSILEGTDGYFSGKQTIELYDDHKMRVTVTGTQTSGTSATIQLLVCSVESGWLAGCDYVLVRTDGTTLTGTISSEPTGMNLSLFDEMKSLTVYSPFGTWKLTYTGTLPCSMRDYRLNYWRTENMQFITGVISTMGSGVPMSSVFEFEFPTLSLEPFERTISETPQKEYCVLKKRSISVAPTPKSISWNNQSLPLSSATKVSYSAPPSDTVFMEALRRNLIDRTARKTGITLDETSVYNKAQVRLSLNTSLTNQRPEQYSVTVTDSLAVLEAATTAGLVNAVQTFDQLLDPVGSFVTGATVYDWPSMPLRAIQFFTGRGTGARDIQIRMLQRVLGSLKVNTLLYECEYINWESVPELRHTTWGMDVSLVKEVIAAAAAQFVEIVPLVNSFGHSEWLLNHFPEYADDPTNRITYDATNPDVYVTVGKVYDECISLFKPLSVHIGHDEIDTYGAYPVKPEAQAIGIHELVMSDTTYWCDFLRARGVRPWAWADMFLYSGETPSAANAESQEAAVDYRTRLPKDLMMVNWDYNAATPADFKGLNILTEAGFDVLAGTWNSTANIENFATAVNEATQTNAGSALGMVQTTWAGFNFTPSTYSSNRSQYELYAAAAEAMWTGGATDMNTFDYSGVFVHQMGENTLQDTPSGGFYCALSTPATDYLPSTVKALPAAWRDRDGWVNRFIAPLPDDPTAEPGIVIAGEGVPMDSSQHRGYSKVTIPIDELVTKLVFIGAATCKDRVGTRIATVRLTYANGYNVTIPIRYGYETYPLTMPYSGVSREAFKAGTLANGKPLFYHAYVYKNSYSTTPILKMTIESYDAVPGWYLREIIGLNDYKATVDDWSLF